MGQLTGNQIQNTYKGLVKLTDSTTGVTSVTQSLQDGLGNNLPIQVSTNVVNISGSLLVNGLPIEFTNTGSLATTGSNVFQGNQIVTGSVNITGQYLVNGSPISAGSNGTSGTSGSSGSNGSSGTSGTSGSNGSDGSSGTSGSSGSSGTSGSSGSSGTSGISGTSGSDGSSGTSGTSGTSGSSGSSGTQGTSGSSGTSGTSGSSGASGDRYATTSVTPNTIGTGTKTFTVGTGLSLTPIQDINIVYDVNNFMNGEIISYNSGTGQLVVDCKTFTGLGTYSNWTISLDGAVGVVGSSGTSGTSGTSGINGTSGSNGSSGTSGSNGSSGTSGSNGTSGSSGTSGINGTSGTSGRVGGIMYFLASTSGEAASSSGYASLSGTTISRFLYLNNIDADGNNIEDYINYMTNGVIQVIGIDGSPNLQLTTFSVTSFIGYKRITCTYLNGTAPAANSFVTLLFTKNGTAGSNGTSGTSGISGSNGTSGSSGIDGTNGTSGTAGTSGSSGTSPAGFSSGTSGTSGINGTSGSSGTSGQNGIAVGRTYYFNQSQTSDVSGYKVLSEDPTTGTTQTVTTTLTNTQQNVLVESYITPELGFNLIPAGVQRFHLHLLKPASNDNVDVYFTLQLANSTGGTIGSLITSSSQYIGWNSGNAAEVEVDVVFTSTVIDPTNRMIVKIYLNNNDNTTHSVNYYTEGADYSYVVTSVGVESGSSGTSGTSGAVDYTGLITTGSISTTQNITGSLLLNGVPVGSGGDRNGLITTGSIVDTQQITGSLILGNTVISGSLVGNTVNSGLIQIRTEASLSGSVQLNISSSSPVSQSNVVMAGAGPSLASLTGSIIISGSNNILFNGARTNTLGQGTLGYIAGNNNLVYQIPVISTSSFLNQQNLAQQNNTLNSVVTFDTFASGTIPSNVDFNNFSGNNIGSPFLLRHKSGSFVIGNNVIQGNFTSFATQSILFPSGAIQGPTVTNNVHAGGGTTLSHISSSIIYSQNISDASGLTIRNSATHPAALNGSGSVSVGNNIFGGGTATLTFNGPGAVVSKGVNNSIVVGNTNELNMISSGSSAFVTNTAVLGFGLIVSGSNSGVGSGGSTFVGRFNATGSNQEATQETIFVVGTGTAANSRRNALRIDNNGNTEITGSVNISGSLLINGQGVVTGSVVTDRNGLITTGSNSYPNQQISGSLTINNNNPGAPTLVITGSLRQVTGSLQLNDGMEGSGVKISEATTNQTIFYYSQARRLGYFASSTNMDQVNTSFGVVSGSESNFSFGGTLNSFRSGSNNLFIQHGFNSFVSGSDNIFVSNNEAGITGGTSNVVIGNPQDLTNGVYTEQILIGTNNKTALRFDGNTNITTITGSLSVGGLVTGSIKGNVVPITVTSNTASLDLSQGNFFTLSLAAGSTHILPTNISAGQTVNIQVSTISGASTTFDGSIRQVSGSLYSPTQSNSRDILTMVSFDGSTINLVNVKNLV